MRVFIIIAILAVSVSAGRSQDNEGNEQILRDMVDSAFKNLFTERSISDLPPFGEYYIAKIGFMNGSKKRMTFYSADSNKIFVFTDTANKVLDSIYATEIKFISFREKGRTGKVIGGAAGAGLAIGGFAGYVSAPCDDCEDGDLSIPGVIRGAGWGIAAGIATGTIGAIVAIFNNGSLKIKGDPKKFKDNFSRLRKYSINRN